MKTLTLSLIAATLLAGTSLAAAPGKPVTLPPAASTDASTRSTPSVRELFGDIVQTAHMLEASFNGPRVACRAECQETKEVCSRSCELWNENGTCAKWAAELVCIEKCVRWSPC